MKHFAVLVADLGDVVWAGMADHALHACSLAARAGNPDVGPFAPHFGSTQDDFALRHLVLNVYDVSSLGEGTTLAHLQANDDELGESLFVGTFAARYED